MSDTTRIELLKPVDISKPKLDKNYLQMIVTHTDLNNGKTDGKKIMDFVTPKDVWSTLQAAKPGDKFEISREKQNGYWQWVGIKALDASTPSATPQATSPATVARTTPAKTERVGNWETPNERAAKQVYIVRQSSLKEALTLAIHQAEGGEVTVEDVTKIAKQFENFVFGDGIAELVSDDLPE